MKTLIIKLIGLIIISVLVWVFAPQIKINNYALFGHWWWRLILTIVIFGWGIIKIYSWKKIKDYAIQKFLCAKWWKNFRLVNNTSNSEHDNQSAIKKYTRQFFGAIKNWLNQNRKLKHDLNHAAWYLIIGQPNSGKQTILEAIELDMMLPTKQFNFPALAEYCNWRFIADNFLISATPPALITNNITIENIPHHAAWESLLRLLKKYRYKKSLNGVIITVDLPTLLTTDNWQTQAQLIKQQLQTLYHRLAARIPVYLLFTKCDLLDGFTNFFMDLDHVERHQPWGITLPLNGIVNITNFLQCEFEQLITQLNERLLWRLHGEPDLKNREKIVCFPQQLFAYQNQLTNFVKEALISNDYFANHCIQFRGMYFTAGQNNVTNKNLCSASVEQKFLLPTINNNYYRTYNSHFITGIFNEIIFPEKLLVGNLPTLKVRQQRKIYYVISGILLLGLVGIKLSYDKNKIAISRAASQMHNYQPITTKQNLPNMIASLNELQKVHTVYQNTPPFAWLLYINSYMPFAINQTHQAALQHVLQTNFIAAITKHLATQLHQYVNESPLNKNYNNIQKINIYDTLKAYLALNANNQIAPNWIVPVINRYLTSALSSSPQQLTYLPRFFTLMLATPFKSVSLNENLIFQVRTKLQKIPLSTRIYWLLQQQAKSLNITEINLSNELGETFEQVFVTNKSPVIPALYTSQGIHLFYSAHSANMVNKLLKNDLVLGLVAQPLSATKKKQLLQELQILYFTDHIAAWNNAINSLHIVPLKNIEHALEVFSLITTRQSPIDRLLSLIEEQRICQSIGLENHTPLNKFKICSANKNQFRIDHKKMRAIRKNLNEIHVILKKINYADNRHQMANDIIKNIIQRDIKQNPFEQLYAQAMQLPATFRHWYCDLAINSLKVIFHEANEVMNHQWQKEILPEYNANFHHRYPIDPHASAEVELSNFIHFFGTGGTLEKFTKQHLQPYLNTTQESWRWKTPLIQQTIAINPAILNLLNKAHHIRTNYFANDGKQLKLFFTLKPLTLDSRLKNINLRIGKREINYQHGPQQSYEYQWPLTNDALKSSLTVTDFSGDLKQLTFEGAWSLFRLLSAAKITTTNSPNVYQLTLQINGYEASFYLTSSAKLPALNLAWLSNFNVAVKIAQ